MGLPDFTGSAGRPANPAGPTLPAPPTKPSAAILASPQGGGRGCRTL